jgi:beta-phosphoglucomutase-like phosphatase (HAD superfamily)
MALEGMIFDVDGTLVDSNDAHAAAWVDAFSEFGYQVPLADVRRRIGMGGDKLVGALTGLRSTRRAVRPHRGRGVA